MARIELRDVTKRWGGYYAVEHLDLTIEDNAFVTLLGPSGCGKTTTLRMIAGLETPTEGQISIDGKVVFDADQGINLPPNKRDVGFLFQNYALWPHMTVYQNIAFGLENLKWDKKRIQERVKDKDCYYNCEDVPAWLEKAESVTIRSARAIDCRSLSRSRRRVRLCMVSGWAWSTMSCTVTTTFACLKLGE